jgi:colanic acid/amylovoran biosynthesis glycosyltransferase
MREERVLNTLHLFGNYLFDTQNWSYTLLENLPNTQVIIASKQFLRCNFYSKKFKYIEFPVKKTETQNGSRISALYNKLAALCLRLYPWYIKKHTESIDLLHSHFAFTAWDYMDLGKRLAVPHVVSFYGYDYESLPFTRPVWRKRYKILFHTASLFVCEGNHGARILGDMGCPREKIKVCKLGVEVDKIPFFVRQKPPGRLNLLQLATMTEKKGHIYTVEAFIKALAKCPNMTLTLVGKDKVGEKESTEAKLREMIAGTIGEGKVRFVKAIEFSRLYAYMKDFDVFIHPSVHTSQMDSEGGAPVVFLDAEATGMPVISTQHCDIPDEVTHEKTGLLAPEKDVDSLVDHICRFYDMADDEYQTFSQAGRKHVEKHYDIKSNARILREIYQDVVNRRKGN